LIWLKAVNCKFICWPQTILIIYLNSKVNKCQQYNFIFLWNEFASQILLIYNTFILMIWFLKMVSNELNERVLVLKQFLLTIYYEYWFMIKTEYIQVLRIIVNIKNFTFR
jgi:hypothetical protein